MGVNYILHGSYASNDYIAGWSDIDILGIVNTNNFSYKGCERIRSDKCIKMKCKWVMSNSNTDPVKEKLKKFNIKEIEARRAINSKNPAAKTKEVVIYN